MPDALKEQVFSRLEELAAVANLSLEDRIAYDKACLADVLFFQQE